MSGSAAEAAFMTGLERNSDIVFAASYAPLLGVSTGLRRYVHILKKSFRALMTSNGYVLNSIPNDALSS